MEVPHAIYDPPRDAEILPDMQTRTKYESKVGVDIASEG